MDIELWELMLPVLTAILAWLANEWRKQAWENFLRKERYYQSLITCMGAFFETEKEQERREFLNQLNLCWLYCPDDVIKKAYAFLNTFQTQATHAARKDSVRELVLAIRKDLHPWYRRTKLTAADFQVLQAR